ncbi:MAG TPA: TolC family protein [Pirellulales bacterium]|nr:TolC family protein [Pirellulales bacterium]
MTPIDKPDSARHKKNAVVAAITGVLFLVLPGCVPALRAPLPAQLTPPGYNVPPGFNGATDAENSAQLPAREFFRDPNLAGLIDQALAGNLQLKILFEDIQIADNEIMRRRGAYLPFFSLGTAASLRKLSLYTLEGSDVYSNALPGFPPPLPGLATTTFPNPLGNFLVPDVDISWQIDIWRQLRDARDAQIQRWMGAINARNYFVTRVVAQIAENYYALLALDARMENLNNVIALQQQSLRIAEARMMAARSTALGVQRFLAEVRKNQSEQRILTQQIIETENNINFLVGRYPQRVERSSAPFINVNLPRLAVGVPPQLLQNRPDIREAERELQATGLDLDVARKNFYPRLMITGGVGYEAYNAKYLYLTPQSLIYNVAGGLTAPLINRNAIRADYQNANARQLQALYEYQRVILNAFIEVVNEVNGVRNYSNSIDFKREQVLAMERSVDIATNLFQNARIEYIDVLFAQRDMWQARRDLIDTKQQQLTAIVDTYQALGGGWQNGPPAPGAAAPPSSPNGAAPPPAANGEALPLPPADEQPLPPAN